METPAPPPEPASLAENRDSQGESVSFSEGSEDANCANEACGEFFESKTFSAFGRVMFRQRYCPACTQREAEKAEIKTDRWPELCPAAYLDTNIEQLRKKARMTTTGDEGMTIEKLLDIPYSKKGVNLIGPPRLGKTRLMFCLLRRYFEQGRYVRYMYAPTFNDELAARWSESPAGANKWTQLFIKTDCWFLDDLGKGRLTERAQSTILRIIEERTNSNRPCYITSNASGDDLIRKMSNEDGTPSDHALPMIERIREFCTPIRFT